MKTILIICIFSLTINSIHSQDGWSSWSTSNCYHGVDFRIKKGTYNEYTKGFKWIMQIKNRYIEPLSLSFNLSSSSKEGLFDRRSVDAGGTTSSYFLIKGVEKESELVIGIKGVKFKGEGDFYECDNKNNPKIEGNKSEISTNESTKNSSLIYEEDDTDKVNNLLMKGNELMSSGLNAVGSEQLKIMRSALTQFEQALKLDPKNEMIKLTVKTQKDLIKTLEGF